MDKEIYYQNYEEDQIDLGEMLKYIWKRAVLIIIIAVLFALLGAGYAYKKNQAAGSYSSTASIYCNPIFDTEDAGYSLNIQEALMDDYIEFVTSRTVIEAAIESLGWDTSYEAVCGSVSPEVKGSRIMEITASNNDPEMAKKLANAVAEATIECIRDYSKYCDPEMLDYANLPTGMSGTGRKSVKKFALIGFVAGLLLGCVLFAVIYVCSDKIFCDYDIKRFLKLNTLAVVKKGDSVEQAVVQIKKEIEFTPVEIDTKKTDLEDYIKALQVAKENQNVIAVVPVGSHAKSVQKIMEKLKATGCKVMGAILKEA